MSDDYPLRMRLFRKMWDDLSTQYENTAALTAALDHYVKNLSDHEVTLLLDGAKVETNPDDIVIALLAAGATASKFLVRVEALVHGYDHIVQIGHLSQDRQQQFDVDDWKIDGVCCCGWEFDQFHESVNSAIAVARLHVKHHNERNDGGNRLSEVELVAEYGRVRN